MKASLQATFSQGTIARTSQRDVMARPRRDDIGHHENVVKESEARIELSGASLVPHRSTLRLPYMREVWRKCVGLGEAAINSTTNHSVPM